MAVRRMFSQKITSSGRFLMMPHESQALYFHLCLNADDDGVVEAYTVLRLTGSKEDNLRILLEKEFVVALNSDLVSYIVDWHEHNLIRADRKVDSLYLQLLTEKLPTVHVLEAKSRADTGKPTGSAVQKTTIVQPMDVQWTAQDRLGKGRLRQQNTKSDFSEQRTKVYVSYNKAFGKSLKPSPAIDKNLEYWLRTYSIEEICSAMESAAKDRWFADKANPVMLLRRRNPNGEEVDYIGRLLAEMSRIGYTATDGTYFADQDAVNRALGSGKYKAHKQDGQIIISPC